MSRIRSITLAISLALCSSMVPFGASATAGITREAVAFTVTNPLVPGATYTVRGTLVRPSGCVANVLLAQHGLSYGAWAWDFDIDPTRYSVAQALASRGYATLAIDRLGYGSSDRPNGYTLTVESYADITRQIVEQLRAAPYGFAHVGLIGHSAGAEVTELAAGLFGGVDVVIPTSYQHAPGGVSQEWLAREWVPGDVVRSTQSDYERFETDDATRAGDMYYLPNADEDVVARDNALQNLTPSGEILSISQQPSRLVLDRITVPVLLVLAEKDALFPSANAEAELALFSGADDRTLHVVEDAGHTFFLHRNAPEANDVIADWLGARQGLFPAC